MKLELDFGYPTNVMIFDCGLGDRRLLIVHSYDNVDGMD